MDISLPRAGEIRVFISYSYDSAEHVARVGTLAQKLIVDGINCDFDLFETSPAQGWARWMLQKIEDSKYVLVVCTETYLKRLEGREVRRVGLGATWEGAIITQDLYEKTKLERQVPSCHIPNNRCGSYPYFSPLRYSL